MKHQSVILTSLVASLLSLNAQASLFRSGTPRNTTDPTQAEMLMDLFKSSCPDEAGQNTTDALALTRNLIVAVKTAANDPACQSLAGAVGSLELMQDRISQLNANPYRSEIASLERQQSELLLLLENPADATSASTLSESLLDVQSTLAKQRGYSKFTEGALAEARRAQGVQDLVAATETLLVAASQSGDCMLKHRGIISGAATLGGTVASALLGGIEGVAVQGGVQLLSAVTEYIQKHKTDIAIETLASPESNHALQCVLSSLSKRRCESRDALKVIDVRQKAVASLNTSGQQEPIYQAIQMLDVHLPVLVKWIASVYTGTDAINVDEGRRKALVISRERAVIGYGEQAIGAIREALPGFDAIKKDATIDPTKKNEILWNLEKKLVKALVSVLTQTYVNGSTGLPEYSPFIDVKNSSYIPFYFIGFPDDPKLKYPTTGGYHDYSTETIDTITPLYKDITGKEFTPSLSGMTSLLQDFVNDTGDAVRREKAAILNENPAALLYAAIMVANTDPESPYDASKALQNFLDQIDGRGVSTGSLRGILKDSRERLGNINKKIDEVANSENPLKRQEALDKLNGIGKEAGFENGATYLSDNLRTAIRVAIDAILRTGKTKLNPIFVQKLLAADDTLDAIQRYASFDSPTALKFDILNSVDVVNKTFSGMTTVFGGSINKMLQGYRAEALQDGWNSPSGVFLAKSCAYMLSMKEWPRNVDWRLCLGSRINSDFSPELSSPVITPVFFKVPVEQRDCIYEDFMRRDRLFNKGRITLSQASKKR